MIVDIVNYNKNAYINIFIKLNNILDIMNDCRYSKLYSI